MLFSRYEGVDIMLTHAVDHDVPLKERTDKANAWKADLFVSIHANAAGDGWWNAAQGIETFVYETRPPAAVALANAVQRQLVKATGRPNRGVKSANFHVLRETKMPAILVECGFMTNREEAELLKSDSYRRKCAEAIVAGIVETYGLRPQQLVQPGLHDWRAEFVAAREWAVESGITDGARPQDPVTRGELWVMLYRAFGAQK
jgi:N-acetylmuramoyl-L-alanine amidase